MSKVLKVLLGIATAVYCKGKGYLREKYFLGIFWDEL